MGRKRKHSNEQVKLVSLGSFGPTPERARQAGEKLVRHGKTGELRINPDKSGIETLHSGAVRVTADALHRLYARRSLSTNPDTNLALYEAGRRFEGLIYQASLDGGARAQQYEGAAGGLKTGIPYSITVQAELSRDLVTYIRAQMASRDYQALEWCVVSNMTVEQGGTLTGAGSFGEGVYLDRLRGALSWLAELWGMSMGQRLTRAIRSA